MDADRQGRPREHACVAAALRADRMTRGMRPRARREKSYKVLAKRNNNNIRMAKQMARGGQIISQRTGSIYTDT